VINGQLINHKQTLLSHDVLHCRRREVVKLVSKIGKNSDIKKNVCHLYVTRLSNNEHDWGLNEGIT